MKMKNNSFASQEYVDDYNNYGIFPKIHNDIAYCIKKFANKKEPCLDICSCTGLLSARSIACGRSFCIGIESNKNSIDRAIKHIKTKFFNIHIKEETLPEIEALIKEYKPTLAIARRALPEIANGDVDIIKNLFTLLHKNGIEDVIIEGRIVSKNSVNILSSIEDEISVIESTGKYLLRNRYKNCAYLSKK